MLLRIISLILHEKPLYTSEYSTVTTRRYHGNHSLTSFYCPLVDHHCAGFTGLIDLQVLLGLIYLLWSGLGTGAGFPSFRIEHMAIMLVAAVVAHLGALWKKSEDKIRFRNSLFIIIDTLIIILLGLARLPGGLSR
jgi:hypothetical protein